LSLDPQTDARVENATLDGAAHAVPFHNQMAPAGPTLQMLLVLDPHIPALSRSARCRLIRSTSYFVGSIFG
jgi:hypothetical protein